MVTRAAAVEAYIVARDVPDELRETFLAPLADGLPVTATAVNRDRLVFAINTSTGADVSDVVRVRQQESTRVTLATANNLVVVGR